MVRKTNKAQKYLFYGDFTPIQGSVLDRITFFHEDGWSSDILEEGGGASTFGLS